VVKNGSTIGKNTDGSAIIVDAKGKHLIAIIDEHSHCNF
jgi:hypothetical protein